MQGDSAVPRAGSGDVNETATEVLFYHLERQPLERVLPNLLERTLARGWRAVVQAGTMERLEAVDAHLWTYADDSFLPHGTAKDGAMERQPIALTVGPENPNGAGVRFLLDGADIESFAGYVRIVVIFDGRDEDALSLARGQWQKVRAQGAKATYWRQSDAGRWEQKA
jgi:DNA polymerase-3 subunit chi